MKIFKTDPAGHYYGVRFATRSGRLAERFFETEEDRSFFLDENGYDGLAFTSPRVAVGRGTPWSTTRDL